MENLLDQSRAPIYEALENFRHMQVVPFDVFPHRLVPAFHTDASSHAERPALCLFPCGEIRKLSSSQVSQHPTGLRLLYHHPHKPSPYFVWRSKAPAVAVRIA